MLESNSILVREVPKKDNTGIFIKLFQVDAVYSHNPENGKMKHDYLRTIQHGDKQQKIKSIL